jgi:hypothetical protein
MSLDRALEQVPLTETEFLDHRAGHKGIGAFAGEIAGRIAQEAVAVGVHLQDARARHERQRLAIFWVIEFLGILSTGRRAAAATSSAATAATAATPAASAAAAAAAIVTSATTLPAAVSTTAAAPTAIFLHVIQHLKQDSLSARPQRQAASIVPPGRMPCGRLRLDSGK